MGVLLGQEVGFQAMGWGTGSSVQGHACGMGMMSAPHSLVNVYEQGGLGFGAPWSLRGSCSLLPHSGGPGRSVPTLAASPKRAGWAVSTAPGLSLPEGKLRLGGTKPFPSLLPSFRER